LIKATLYLGFISWFPSCTRDIMALHSLHHAALILALTTFSIAQTPQSPTILPSDLQSGFQPNGDTLQVSFTNEAINGFQDGTIFPKDSVKNEPTFALGDSSGISPSTLYTIIMVDTTCPNARTLHYARTNFKNNFDITNINTSTPALQAYLSPGSLDEKGDDRQYAFLMYTNPGRDEIDAFKLPAEGETFDVKQFQDDNGLGDAEAGVGMVVKLGGEADCGGDAVESLPASLPTPRPSTSTAAPSRAPLSSSEVTDATTTGAEEPESTDSAEDGGEGSVTTTSERTPSSTLKSFVLESAMPEPSSVASTVVLKSAGGEGTTTGSAGLAEQTASAAPALSNVRVWGFTPLLVVVGMSLW
jgi:hypothetical protein